MMARSGILAVCAALALAGCSNKMTTLSGNAPVAGASTVNPASAAYFRQSVGDTVLFAVDESTLSAAARATLSEQAKWLTRNSGFSAVIEGHADEQGTREYNLALGAKRASAVQEFLINAGVAPSRLSTLTYGKERPLEICSVEACYAKNRRAVTVVTAGAGV